MGEKKAGSHKEVGEEDENECDDYERGVAGGGQAVRPGVQLEAHDLSLQDVVCNGPSQSDSWILQQPIQDESERKHLVGRTIQYDAAMETWSAASSNMQEQLPSVCNLASCQGKALYKQKPSRILLSGQFITSCNSKRRNSA